MTIIQKRVSLILAMLATATALSPASALACACGCGVFDISTGAMLPTHEGGMVFTEYDFMNQNKNWHGSSSAPREDNDDKDIKSQFVTVGGEYMFNRSWGIEGDVKYITRHFTTTDDTTGDIAKFNASGLGDIRIKGVYSGFSEDMSSGITFGLKLPTGDTTPTGFDRDTALGSGSTDLLLGAYHMGALAGEFNWFANGELDQPTLTSNSYRPGTEVNAVTGVYYNGFSIGGVKIAPVAQIIESYRTHDRGLASDPDNSGYQRVLLSPGVEVDTNGYRLYADVAVPVYQQVRGNQLVAPELFKVNISHSF